MRFSASYWQRAESRIEFTPADSLPENIPVTAVKIAAISEGEVLLVNTPKGWDIPGGRTEAGETLLEALEREVTEETAGTLTDVTLIGYISITKTKENEYNKQYPALSLIAIYTGTISNIQQDALTHESTAAEYFPPNNLPDSTADWSALSQELVEYATALTK